MHYPRLHYVRSPSLHNNRKLRHCTGEGNGSTPVLLPGKSHGQRSLVGYSPRGHKESDTTERLHFLSGHLAGKESACKAGDPGSVPGLERSPGGGHGNTLQYSCLENPVDKGAWQVTVHRITESQTGLKQLSTHTHTSLEAGT